MIHPLPPENPRPDLLDLAVFIACMVATAVFTGLAAWIYTQGGQP